MPSLDMCVEHKLPKDEAKQKISGLLDKLRETYNDKISNVKQDWNGYVSDFSFTLMGFKVGGKIIVSEKSVCLDGKIPFTALPFKGIVQNTIREKATELLV